MTKKEDFTVVKYVHGLAGMILCAPKDASDDALRFHAELLNPCGTICGWSTVVRDDPEHPARNPVACIEHPKTHLHFILTC